MAGSSSISEAALRHGLAAEYLFAGSASDTSGHGRHGVVHGAALTADRFGRPDHAYRFDGIDDYIEVHPPPTLGRDAMSVSVWAAFDRRNLEGWTSSIVAQDNGDDDDQSRRVFQLSASEHHVVWHRMICNRDPECKHRIRFGQWYHFVATVSGGRHTLYLDGVRQDEEEGKFWTHPEQPLHIGRKGTIEKHFYFKGAIDDLRLWDRALSSEEVRALFGAEGFVKPAPLAFPPASDPLSGRWGRHGINFLDLRLQPGGVVSGHVMDGRPERRAEVKSGSFDRSTGALLLEGDGKHPKSGEKLAYRIEGVLDDGEITLTAHFGGWSGNFSLTRNGARWPWRYRVARTINRGVRRVLGLRDFEGPE